MAKNVNDPTNEDRIQLALHAFWASEIPSVRQTAKRYGIARTTLCTTEGPRKAGKERLENPPSKAFSTREGLHCHWEGNLSARGIGALCEADYTRGMEGYGAGAV